MNTRVRPPRADTQHRFTNDDVQHLQAEGFFPNPKKIVLLDGVIHQMPHDGFRHVHWAMEIAARLMQVVKPQGCFVGVQTTLRLDRSNGPSPDVWVLKGAYAPGDTPGDQIALVIEVADTSLEDDLTDSAERYARFGVGEYWVVDVENAVTHVHRAPVDGAYPAVVLVPFTEPLTPAALPGFTIRLADLAPAP